MSSEVCLLIPQQDRVEEAVAVLNDNGLLHCTVEVKGKVHIMVSSDDTYTAEDRLLSAGYGVSNETEGLVIFRVESSSSRGSEAVRIAVNMSERFIPCWIQVVDPIMAEIYVYSEDVDDIRSVLNSMFGVCCTTKNKE